MGTCFIRMYLMTRVKTIISSFISAAASHKVQMNPAGEDADDWWEDKLSINSTSDLYQPASSSSSPCLTHTQRCILCSQRMGSNPYLKVPTLCPPVYLSSSLQPTAFYSSRSLSVVRKKVFTETSSNKKRDQRWNAWKTLLFQSRGFASRESVKKTRNRPRLTSMLQSHYSLTCKQDF